MSTCISKEISCPVCGAVHKDQMWVGMECSANPGLRRRILKENLFAWECPTCGHPLQLIYPCLYHDKAKGLMIALAPSGTTSALKNVRVKYPQMNGVTKRLVATPEDMKEKILIFEAGLDDLAVEMVKLALMELVEKKRGSRVERAYYVTHSEELDYIGFTFFLSEQEKPVHQGTRMQVYHKSLEIAKRMDFSDDGSFLQVDAALAQTLLEDI